METMQTLEKWQDEFLTMMKKVETPVVRFTGERAETMARVLPDRPAFMTHLPSMTELVDNQLKFRRRLVDEQAAFVRRMLKAMQPMVHDAPHGTADSTPETVAKPRPAPRRAAHPAS
jgi:hypothetical protein